MRYIYIYIYTQRSNQWTDTWRGVYWIRRRGKEGKEQRGIMLRIKCNNMSRISRLELRKREKKISGEGRNDKNDSWKNCDDLERTCIERVQVSGESTRFRLKYVIRSNLNAASSLSIEINSPASFLALSSPLKGNLRSKRGWSTNFDVDDFLIGFLIITGIKLRIYDRRGS